MKLSKMTVCLLLAGAISGGAVHAAGPSQVAIFGDSLSDAGTFAAVAAGGGRFTTNPGPVWSERVTTAFGLVAAPAQKFTGTGYAANPAGNIWAQGGARVTGSPGFGMTMALPVSTQIDAYLARQGGRADSKGLYAVWAGANDIFTWTTPATSGGASAAAVQANVSTAAQQLVAQVARLQTAGARQIVVFNLPDMGRSPAALAAGASGVTALTGLSQLYNATLSGGLATAGVAHLQLDAYRLFNEILSNPAAWGFAVGNAGVACLPPGSSSLTCTTAQLATPTAASTFLFADGVHPTTAAHQIIADYALASLNASRLPALAAEQAATVADAQLRTTDGRLRQWLDGGLPDQAARWFVEGEVVNGEISARTGLAGRNEALDGHPRQLAVGAEKNFADGWFGGLALSMQRQNHDLSGVGSVNSHAVGVGLYGGKRWGAAYVSTALTLATLNSDLDRNLQLGAVARREFGEASGSVKGLRAEVGYDLSQGDLRHGPLAGVAYRRVHLGGYQEASGNASALAFGGQTYDLLRSSLGYQVSAQVGAALRLSGRLTHEYEHQESMRDLMVGMPGSGSAAPFAVGRDQGGYGQLALAADWKLSESAQVTAQLQATSSHEGSRETALSLAYSARF